MEILKKFIKEKLKFATAEKEKALKNEDGSDIYWDGVIYTCQDILNVLEPNKD